MNIPVRVIGIATTTFWVFLIIFAITAAYSVKDLQFDLGEPQMSMTTDNELLFSLPINILNKGYYNIGRFNVTTEISNSFGMPITGGSSFIPVIRTEQRTTVYHNVTLDFDDLLALSQIYLFSDSEFNVAVSVGLSLAELIPVQASANFSVPWGAPLYDFALGSPTYELHNLTHIKAIVPISFENHAFFDLVGDVEISMFNSSDDLIGLGIASLGVPQNSPFSGQVELYIMMFSATMSGRLEANIHTPVFNYGPWVIPYG